MQDILQRFCIKDSFEDSVLSLQELFGLRVSKLTAEKHNQEFGAYIEQSREESLCEDLDEEEAEILVATADGKGVPMRNTVEESRGLPETPLQKHHRKKRRTQLLSYLNVGKRRDYTLGHARITLAST